MSGLTAGDGASKTQRFVVGTRSPTRAVVESVARFRGQHPLELSPLARGVNANALDRLITSRDDVVIRFRYEGTTVRIASSGEILVEASET